MYILLYIIRYSLCITLYIPFNPSKGVGLFTTGPHRQLIAQALPEITFNKQWLQG